MYFEEGKYLCSSSPRMEFGCPNQRENFSNVYYAVYSGFRKGPKTAVTSVKDDSSCSEKA